MFLDPHLYDSQNIFTKSGLLIRRTPLRYGATRDEGYQWPVVREHLDPPREEALDHERDNGLVSTVRSRSPVINR